jgi:hypothetical protein
MDTDTQLIESVKSWIQLDDQLRDLQSQSKVVRKAKADAALQLSEIMQTKDIGTINLAGDSKIVRREKTSRGSLTKKYLVQCLGQLFAHDAPQQERIVTHILDNRPVKVRDEVQRK